MTVKYFWKVTGAVLLTCISALPLLANVRTAIPSENPGPPAYSQIQRAIGPYPFFIPHTDEWAAIPFLRNTACVPPNFNLLDFNDFTPAFPGGPPRPFVCPLTAEGFALWKNGPPPIDFVPIFSELHGTGSVPVWFVSWAELLAAVADDNLTLAELSAMGSLQVGYADFYNETVQPGVNRPQGPGNGKIEINALGILLDGRSFQLSIREMGDDGISLLRHARIEFR
jgi:hypothetical protein